MFDTSACERTAPDDQYFNYCWWPYEPVAATVGKLRPVSLLYRSFELAHVAAQGSLWVEHLQRRLGRFRTVYGVKWNGREFEWELYFYDYNRRQRALSASRFVEAVAPLVSSSLVINERLPYFMFSIDLDAALLTGQRTLDAVHLYLGNPGSSVSSGVSYVVTASETRLENFYFFFAEDQLHDVAAKIGCSVHFDATRNEIEQILRPELCSCRTICIANKQCADTAYFSGVDVDQLLHFLQWRQFPRDLIEYTNAHRDHLDHLLYDVGVDYATSPNGWGVGKSGFYGVF